MRSSAEAAENRLLCSECMQRYTMDDYRWSDWVRSEISFTRGGRDPGKSRAVKIVPRFK